jgi:hypothetical protein
MHGIMKYTQISRSRLVPSLSLFLSAYAIHLKEFYLMAIQDLLTVAIESTFVASVLFFSVQFTLFVATNPFPRCRHRYVPPTPIATPVQPVIPRPVQTALPTLGLPAITVIQAGTNLDAQISRLPDMTTLAADSCSYTASLPKARKASTGRSRLSLTDPIHSKGIGQK